MLRMKVSLLVMCVIFVCAFGEEVRYEENVKPDDILGKELVEKGRTFVHHAVKRFMVILPAIFFKLGVAFTLLLLVTLVAVNNGFIGFLILVVGLSSLLARLQDARRPAVAPVVYAHPPAVAYAHGHHHHPLALATYAHHHHIDRSDVDITTNNPLKRNVYQNQPQPSYDYSNGAKYTDIVYNHYGGIQKL